jgi:hypothetical protein
MAEKGALAMYGNEYYYALKDIKNKTGSIKFNFEVTSYCFLSAKRKEVAVALGTKELVLLIDSVKFVLNSKISTEMSIR